MARIDIGGSVCPTSRNTPTREGQRVATKADIANIRLPYVSMIIYVEADYKFYYVSALNEAGKVLTYKELVTTSEGGLTWKGEVDTIAERDALNASSKGGDVVAVKDVGNFAFVEREVYFTTEGSSARLDIGDAIKVPSRNVDSNPVAQLLQGGQYKNVYMVKKTGTTSTYLFVSVKSEGEGVVPDYDSGQYAYIGGALVLAPDAGQNMLLCTIDEAHWSSMGGEGVTTSWVNGQIDDKIEDYDGTMTEALSGKQASLTTAQLAAVNSGITATKVTNWDNCLVGAAEKTKWNTAADNTDALMDEVFPLKVKYGTNNSGDREYGYRIKPAVAWTTLRKGEDVAASSAVVVGTGSFSGTLASDKKSYAESDYIYLTEELKFSAEVSQGGQTKSLGEINWVPKYYRYFGQVDSKPTDYVAAIKALGTAHTSTNKTKELSSDTTLGKITLAANKGYLFAVKSDTEVTFKVYQDGKNEIEGGIETGSCQVELENGYKGGGASIIKNTYYYIYIPSSSIEWSFTINYKV